MEKYDSKCQLLEKFDLDLELPVNSISRRRNKKTECIMLAVNFLLCLITCIATVICITYCSKTLSEFKNAKASIAANLDIEVDTTDEIYDQHTYAELHQSNLGTHTSVRKENDSLYSENTEGKDAEGNKTPIGINEDKQFRLVDGTDNDDYETDYESYDDEDYDDYIEDSNSDHNGRDDSEETELDGSGEITLDDEDYGQGRHKRSLTLGDVKEKSEKDKKKDRNSNRKPCKGKQCKSRRKNRKGSSPLIVQYEATVSDAFVEDNLPLYDEVLDTDGCRYVVDMRGKLCRSRLFTPIDHKAPLNIFHSATWTSNKKSPLQQVDGSSAFQVKTGGIMLVFAQVSFSTTQPTNGASIVQSRPVPLPQIVQELQCRQGIPDPDSFAERVNQSCSIVGLLNVEKGDRLEIYSNYKGSSLDLSAGSTYFGVVHLTK